MHVKNSIIASIAAPLLSIRAKCISYALTLLLLQIVCVGIHAADAPSNNNGSGKNLNTLSLLFARAGNNHIFIGDGDYPILNIEILEHILSYINTASPEGASAFQNVFRIPYFAFREAYRLQNRQAYALPFALRAPYWQSAGMLSNPEFSNFHAVGRKRNAHVRKFGTPQIDPVPISLENTVQNVPYLIRYTGRDGAQTSWLIGLRLDARKRYGYNPHFVTSFGNLSGHNIAFSLLNATGGRVPDQNSYDNNLLFSQLEDKTWLRSITDPGLAHHNFVRAGTVKCFAFNGSSEVVNIMKAIEPGFQVGADHYRMYTSYRRSFASLALKAAFGEYVLRVLAPTCQGYFTNLPRGPDPGAGGPGANPGGGGVGDLLLAL